jgi:hypothetical protein
METPGGPRDMDVPGIGRLVAVGWVERRRQTEPREWLRDMAPGCEDECGGLKARHGHEAAPHLSRRKRVCKCEAFGPDRLPNIGPEIVDLGGPSGPNRSPISSKK